MSFSAIIPCTAHRFPSAIFVRHAAFLAVNGSVWNTSSVFFAGAYASRLIGNTIMISLYSLAAGFPLPIFLAVMLNEIGCLWFKKTVQLVTYAPHFLSAVAMVGMLTSFLSKDSGIINQFIRLFHGTPVNFMIEPGMFKTIYVVSGIWQSGFVQKIL